MDEPTNFLDREALGGLAVAIRNWGGAVCIISHSTEFVTALCPEIWHVDQGRLTQQGKVAVLDEAFDDPSRPTSRTTSARGTPRGGGSTVGGTPATSAGGTPAGSGAEDGAKGLADGVARLVVRKKKKKTRNQLKEQEERRRIRKLNWLNYGGESALWNVGGRARLTRWQASGSPIQRTRISLDSRRLVPSLTSPHSSIPRR